MNQAASDGELSFLSGKDHAALAAMPISVAVTHDAPPVWSYAYRMEIAGQTRRVEVTLEPGAGGYPTHSDQMVYLALLQLAVAHGREDAVSFKRREVFDLLGWGAERKNAYERFREALRRLAGVLVVVQSQLLSRDGQAYNQDETGVHLIDSYKIGKGRDATCRVEWGKLVREAFRLNDLKALDWQLMLALGNPLSTLLYRLVDRATLGGQTVWKVGWKALAAALGMRVEAYARPARFKQVLEPHLAALIEQRVVDAVDYERGGTFIFHVPNYLRVSLRRVLTEQFGVYDEAARQLLAGYEEVAIMAQCDCLYHGARTKPTAPGGYLVEAVRRDYELRYPADDAARFLALWELLGQPERAAYQRAGLKLIGAADDLFETNADPSAWSQTMRAVVRFLVCHNLDPEQLAPA